jgi:nucleosome assembly protein 1-like 1
LLADEPILKNVKGCEIQWKPGKSLTFLEVTKQQRGKGKNAGQLRTVTRKERVESFFHFFTPPKMPNLENMDEEEAIRLEAAFNEDYDFAQAFRSHIIPKAVMWFTGDALEKEMEEAMEGMEWPPGVNASPSGDENPECKQS